MSTIPRVGFVQSVCLALLAMAIIGCGGGPNPELAGLWAGPVVVQSTNGKTIQYSGTLSIQVEDKGILVSGICPGGTGRLHVAGEGNEFEFHGADIVCSVGDASCPSAVLTYQSGTLRLSNDTIFVTGSGDISGCNGFSYVTTTFTGVRQ